MKRIFPIFAVAVMASLLSVSAHAVTGFKCYSGLTPKFKDNKATFLIEPFLWDDDGTRGEIVRAFEAWNNATGYKMDFKYSRGNDDDPGYVGDGVHQVRRSWLWQNPLDESDHFAARSVALHTSDPGQCHWYDSDIELSFRYFREGVYNPSNGWTLYSLMLHEIGHAMGIEHNDKLSVVNLAWWGTNGLFAHDIQFARELYGLHESNIKRNFRADKVMLANGLLRDYYNVTYDFANRSISVPYTVTNTGTSGEEVLIDILYTESGQSLFSSSHEVLGSFSEYIGAGRTASSYHELQLSPEILSKLYTAEATLAFRIVADDSYPWDDVVSVY